MLSLQGGRTASPVFGGTVNEVTVDTPFALLESPTCKCRRIGSATEAHHDDQAAGQHSQLPIRCARMLAGCAIMDVIRKQAGNIYCCRACAATLFLALHQLTT